MIITQNEENECFHWCHVRYINPKTEIPLDKMPCDNQKLVIFDDYLHTGTKNDVEIRNYFTNSRNKNCSRIYLSIYLSIYLRAIMVLIELFV